MSLTLASASPRRRALLEALGVHIGAIRPADVDETPRDGESPETYARRVTRSKVSAIVADLVLAADTVVHLDGRLFGKPADIPQAREFLRLLAGHEHRVTTAWALATRGRVLTEGQVTSHVRFRPLSTAEIAAYVATGEGMDKAGAYGVQGLGAALIASVQGSYSNVVGLPLEHILPALASHGVYPEAP